MNNSISGIQRAYASYQNYRVLANPNNPAFNDDSEDPQDVPPPGPPPEDNEEEENQDSIDGGPIDGAVGGAVGAGAGTDAPALMVPSSDEDDEEMKRIDLEIKRLQKSSIRNDNYKDHLPKKPVGPFSIEEAVDGEPLPDHCFLGSDSTDDEIQHKHLDVPRRKKADTPKLAKNAIKEED